MNEQILILEVLCMGIISLQIIALFLLTNLNFKKWPTQEEDQKKATEEEHQGEQAHLKGDLEHTHLPAEAYDFNSIYN